MCIPILPNRNIHDMLQGASIIGRPNLKLTYSMEVLTLTNTHENTEDNSQSCELSSVII